jgi:hypothetical protein
MLWRTSVAGALVLLGASAPLWSQSFTPTGNLTIARSSHQAILLPDGRVLASGGQNAAAASIPQAEIFDTLTGTWSITGSNLVPRQEHAAVLLADGRVLVVGGVGHYFSCTSDATAETYDATTGMWSLTSGLPAPVGSGLIAIRLMDGRVLAAGGGNRCGSVFSTAALFDPTTNSWSVTGSMTIPREFHSAVLLPDGRVLVAGGATSAPFNFVTSAEVYDPGTGTWSAVGSAATTRGTSCDGYVQTYLAPLQSGNFLAAGAFAGSCSFGVFSTAAAEVFDTASMTWSATGAMNTPRSGTTLTTLTDGTVLVAGGFDAAFAYLTSGELFDPAVGTWTLTGSLTHGRVFHTATLLANGDVLVAGGSDASGRIASAEIYKGVPDDAAPVISVTSNPTVLWPPNGKVVPVVLSGAITDHLSGVDPQTPAFQVSSSSRTGL